MENGFLFCDEICNVEIILIDENGKFWLFKNILKGYYGEMVILKWGFVNLNNWILVYLMSKLNLYVLVCLIYFFGVCNKEI